MIKKIIKKTQRIKKLPFWEWIKRREEIRKIAKEIDVIEKSFSLNFTNSFPEYQAVRDLLIIAKKQQRLIENGK